MRYRSATLVYSKPFCRAAWPVEEISHRMSPSDIRTGSPGGDAMAKKQKKEKKRWKFLWKNVGGLGRLNRIAAGAALLYGASKLKDDPEKAAVLAGFGTYLIVIGGLLGWCSLRAVCKKPTKRARLRHYPETE